ncbi:MAG: dipeptidase, partial [Chloroflexota bacterium]|nr:dipeptidase [Chloroflexota bacterium]
YAQRITLEMAALLFRLQAASEGRLKVVRTASELESCISSGVMSAIMHCEGAEAIDPAFDALEVLYQAGLRSLGPVWSRANIFGEGVPFRNPSPDTGPGLTALGRDLVRACNRLRIMIDLSHMNEKSFWDVAALSDAPLVATHSNAHALCPTSRNLTDRQLDAIKESDGMVGVNFGVHFLRTGGDPAMPVEAITEHIDYLVERLGIDRVGFGSDFDGTVIPTALGDVTGLPPLLTALSQRGYDEVSLRKLAHENWVRVLRATWGA